MLSVPAHLGWLCSPISKDLQRSVCQRLNRLYATALFSVIIFCKILVARARSNFGSSRRAPLSEAA